MKRLIILCIVFLCILMSVSFGTYLFLSQTKKNETYVILHKIQSLNRLETMLYSMEKIIDIQNNTQGLQKVLLGDQLLYVAYGEVYAGVDLSKIKPEDIQKQGNQYKLLLPPAEILSVRIDPKKSYVYDRKKGLLTKGEKNLEQKALQEAELIFKESACSNGILDQATEQAKKQIEYFFQKTDTPLLIQTQKTVCTSQ